MGAGFPLVGATSPLVGEAFPLVGEVSPLVGGSCPLKGEVAPQQGESFPHKGGIAPPLGGNAHLLYQLSAQPPAGKGFRAPPQARCGSEAWACYDTIASYGCTNLRGGESMMSSWNAARCWSLPALAVLLLAAGRAYAFGPVELLSKADPVLPPHAVGTATNASLSADGRYVAFESSAPNLLPGVHEGNNG